MCLFTSRIPESGDGSFIGGIVELRKIVGNSFDMVMIRSNTYEQFSILNIYYFIDGRARARITYMYS